MLLSPGLLRTIRALVPLMSQEIPQKLKLPRRPWVVVLAVVCIAVAVSFSVWFRVKVTAKQDAEYWINRLGAESMRIPGNEWGLRRRHPEVPAAALRRIGPSVVPVCVEVLRRGGTHESRLGAVIALALYGSEAAPAIPALIEQIQDIGAPAEGLLQLRKAAIRTVLQTGPGVDVARTQLTAAVRRGQSGAARPLNEHVRQIWAAYALVSIDEGNRDGIKVLTDALSYKDTAFRTTDDGLAGGSAERRVRGEALGALFFLASPSRPSRRKLHPIDESTAVPLAAALLNIVQTAAADYGTSDTRQLALSTLEGIGPSARTVVPALRALLEDTSEASLHPWVRAALKEIDRPVEEVSPAVR